MRILVALVALGVVLAGCAKDEVTTQDVEQWSKAEGAAADPEPEPR